MHTLILAVVFLIGVVGNVAALWILYRFAKTRNRKHVLLLRCLATNDLIAEVGMLIMLYLRTSTLDVYSVCVVFVLLRAFGIGSGCVALVMALERWLALTRPFLYQQLVTYRILKRFIFTLWSAGAILTLLPLVGFGVYYEQNANGTLKCKRYNEAETLSGQVYAYIFFGFGTTLCVCIAICNLTVIWELSRIRSQGRLLVRRVSRSIIQNNNSGCAVRYHQTPEEVAFAKLMAIICIIFVVCWASQMISIPLAQFVPKSRFYGFFSSMANFLMCAYFTLDPYVYVLQRYLEKGRYIFGCCFSKSRPTGVSSLPTTTTTAGTPTSVLLHPPSFTSPAVM